jgi:hypothetical protein
MAPRPTRLCRRCGAVTLGSELEAWRDGEPDPLDEGLDQLNGDLAGLGLESGWRVVFDRRSAPPPIRERPASVDSLPFHQPPPQSSPTRGTELL